MNEIEPVLPTSTGNGGVPDPFAAPGYSSNAFESNGFQPSFGAPQQQQLQQNTMANSAANSAAASGFADFSKLQLSSVSCWCTVSYCTV
jgi:hypothetical protein